jgi:hypothetical protein
MGIEEDTLRELKLLNQNFASMLRNGGATARSAARSDGVSAFELDKKARRGSKAADSQDKAVSSYDSAAKKFLKSSGNLTKDIAGSRETLKELRSSWKEGAESMFDMKERIDKWGNSIALLTQQAGKVVAGMSRFQSSVAKSTKAQSLLYAEQLRNIQNFKDFEKAAYFDELAKSLGALSNGAKRQLGVIDAATGKMRTDLDLSEFSKIRNTLGELQASIKESLDGSQFKSLADVVAAGKDAFTHRGGLNDHTSVTKEAIAKTAAMMQSMGLYRPGSDSLSALDKDGVLKGAAELNKVDWEGLAKQLALLEMSFDKTNKSLDHNIDAFNDKWARFIRSIDNAEGRKVAMDSAKKLALTYLSVGAATDRMKKGLADMYKQVTDFNVAQVPATYKDVNMASVQLGLTFDETTKLMQDNKRILAIYGPKQFTSSMTDMSKTFQKYGFNMQQAAETIGPTVESAIEAGINIRDPGQLNKFTDQMLDSFQKISGIVNISAKDFMALNGQLFKSEGTFETLLGLDQQRRQSYTAELVQLRTKYVAQGLEIQQAQQLVQLQQQQQRGSLKDRMGDAAKAMALAQVSGLGSDASQEIFNLTRKGRRTAQEDARLQQLYGQLSSATEGNINAGYLQSDAAGDIRNEARLALMPSGSVGQMINAGAQMSMVGQAGGAVSGGEQARAASLAQGNASVAQLGNAVNTVSAVMSNAFLGAIVSSAGALLALTLQAGRLSSLLGGVGGPVGTLLGSGGAKPGGMLSKLGGIGGGLVGAVAKGALGMGAQLALGYGADALKDGAVQGSARQGAGVGLSVLGDVAKWGGTGATIGSIIPGVGTAIGGGVGAALGLGMGLYNNSSDIKAWWNTPSAGMPISNSIPRIGIDSATTPDSVNTPQAGANGPGILGVSDRDANAQLQVIAQNMAMAVQFLQKMAEKQQQLADGTAPASIKTNAASGALPVVPSAYEYATGRSARLA